MAPEIPYGAEIVALTDAMGSTSRPVDPIAARAAMQQVAGDEATERAIGVAATFQMMNRLLDGVGAPVHPHLHGFAVELGFHPDELPR